MRRPSYRAACSALAVCAAAILYFALFSQSDPFGTGIQALDVAGRAADFLN